MGKGADGETEPIVGAGKADITKQWRDHALRVIISIFSYDLVHLRERYKPLLH